MTDIDITAALALCETATPAPLWADEEGRGGYNAHAAWYGISQANDEIEPGVYSIMNKPELMMFKLKADAEFFVAARTGWPSALHALQEARAEVERLRSMLPKCAGKWTAGSGGHRTYDGQCSGVGIWDVGGWYVCDEHKAPHVGDADAWQWTREREVLHETIGDAGAINVERALMAESSAKYFRAERDAARADAHENHLAAVRMGKERDAERELHSETAARQHENAMKVCESLSAHNSSLAARVLELEGERERVETHLVALIDAAHSGPVEVPDDVPAEIARIVRAVRINVTMREKAEQKWKDIDALRSVIIASTAESIAAWLESPKPGAPNAVVTGPLLVIAEQVMKQAATAIRAGAYRTAATGGGE